jgi:7-carboxy-7-deazaguanine synthase
MRPMSIEHALRVRPAGTYRVNEVFYSLQGEGGLAGTAMVFVRFSDCNLRCARDNEAGFDCDTEFMGGQLVTLEELLVLIRSVSERGEVRPPGLSWILATGGEPALQLDDALVTALHAAEYRIAVETNGTLALPTTLTLAWDWVCVSPKTAEHTIRQRWASEVKYVRHAQQALPEPSLRASLQWLSPAALPTGQLDPDAVRWCIDLVKENPAWRLSVQQHKYWNVR